MNGNWFVQRNQRRDIWLIVGWLLIVVLGVDSSQAPFRACGSGRRRSAADARIAQEPRAQFR